MTTFIAKSSELAERFDPRFHSPVFSDNLTRIRSKRWFTIGKCCRLSEETWDKSRLFSDRFPYIEIGAIDTIGGEIAAIEPLPTNEAPSRAQMVVRTGDILVSMTRPTRNAIARMNGDTNIAIASTGFAVIRTVDSGIVLPDYLFHVLRLNFCTLQFDQRSSGGNYPAITKDDLRKVAVPVPPLDVQERIVAKLDAAYAAKRKADKKEAELLASIDGVVFDALGIPTPAPPDASLASRIFTIPSRELAGRTLSPSHYRERISLVSSKHVCRSFLDVVTIDPVESISGASRPYHLVPMEAVSAEYGCIERVEEVEGGNMGGYSTFRDGDVIFAKISPCMENGKSAVVSTGFPGIIFGSTEFLVFRPKDDRILPEYLHLILRLDAVRKSAGRNLSGTTGHQRITKDFFRDLALPVPPKPVQEKLVAKIASIRARAKDLKADALSSLAAAKKHIESEIVG
jgi:type I restriction enzyme S subunit